MSLFLYVSIIVFVSLGAYFFYKDRLQLMLAGLIQIFVGLYWLHTQMIPGRLTSDITGQQAIVAGWFTVICGIALIVIKPRKDRRRRR